MNKGNLYPKIIHTRKWRIAKDNLQGCSEAWFGIWLSYSLFTWNYYMQPKIRAFILPIISAVIIFSDSLGIAKDIPLAETQINPDAQRPLQISWTPKEGNEYKARTRPHGELIVQKPRNHQSFLSLPRNSKIIFSLFSQFKILTKIFLRAAFLDEPLSTAPVTIIMNDTRFDFEASVFCKYEILVNQHSTWLSPCIVWRIRPLGARHCEAGDTAGTSKDIFTDSWGFLFWWHKTGKFTYTRNTHMHMLTHKAYLGDNLLQEKESREGANKW